MPPTDELAICRAREDDARAFASYLVKHVAESGHHGSPHFALSRTLVPEEAEQSALARWRRRLDEPLWGRAFLLWTCGPHAVPVGHLELRGGRVGAELHRALLGMGMLRRYTGQGHGRRLLEVAIRWAREEAGLSYIDLGVFTSNQPAYRLYRKLGFVEQGLRQDAFRVEGAILDDVQMTLALRPPSGERAESA